MGEIGFLSQWLRTGAVLWVFCSPGEASKFRRVIFRGTRYSQLRWALLGLSNTEPFSLTSNSGLPDRILTTRGYTHGSHLYELYVLGTSLLLRPRVK